jgi:hypothetical protein
MPCERISTTPVRQLRFWATPIRSMAEAQPKSADSPFTFTKRPTKQSAAGFDLPGNTAEKQSG